MLASKTGDELSNPSDALLGCLFVGETVYSIQGSKMCKKRKSAAERQAEQAAKATRLDGSGGGNGKWALDRRQPWAEKEPAVVALTEEEQAFMDNVRRVWVNRAIKA